MKLVVHRGTNINSEENSIEGIKEIRELTKTSIIEIDIVPTKDNKLILFHDLSLKRHLNIDKLILDFDFEQLNSLKDNKSFISLKDIIQLFPEQKFLLDFRCNFHKDYFPESKIDIETLKDNLLEKYLSELELLNNKKNIILMCSDITKAKSLQKLGFEVDLSENFLRGYLDEIKEKKSLNFLDFKFYRVHIQNKLLSKDLVEIFHKHNIEVFSTPSMKRSIESSNIMLEKAIELKCDGIWLSPINSKIIDTIEKA
ncbi:hypothetical protein CP960_13540 [Malaciobacter halophilus]|uniref:GP-PDE domain-containing protein n=1 Tax=Malaciobacter halophilus TaxID=197482 RepID=A0A2N1IZA6_9BACT|nr:glycerophosphodiester phosphodiesterase family protein [Malaciobacter halophilus]AXH10881.1 glycerophosphodiester phosphodiesterase [Malaciobacter halophilus]PKI79628.1 hypothetical protein CP960_13540 [Malaciobacter halophilus]